jgi:hypothetical protein
MPAARGHDHRPVHLRAPLRYPGPRDQRRGATGAPGLQRRAARDHRQRGRPRGGSGYPPGQVAEPSASRRSPGSPLPPGPRDEPPAPPRPGRADGYLSPIDWRGADARDRIREITARDRLLLWPELIVEDLNSFLRGAGPGTSVTGTRLSCSARSGITPWNGSRSGCPRKATGGEPGMGHQTGAAIPGHMGLIILDGTVIPPRPFRPWRGQAERRR